MKPLTHFLAALALAGALSPSWAQTPPPAEQPVQPQVERRDVKLPRMPSTDFEVGLFFGLYSVQNFGTQGAAGLRLAYHLTEDWFVEAALGQATVSDEAFRRVLPGGVITPGEEKLKYMNLSAGYNLLPGELFLGAQRALPTQLYLIGGVGTTRFNGQRAQSFNLGMGWRVFLRDEWALRVDLRDHLFPLDLLGKRERTHNPELTLGASFLF
jgi:outer membrane beta-barrel protein